MSSSIIFKLVIVSLVLYVDQAKRMSSIQDTKRASMDSGFDVDVRGIGNDVCQPNIVETKAKDRYAKKMKTLVEKSSTFAKKTLVPDFLLLNEIRGRMRKFESCNASQYLEMKKFKQLREVMQQWPSKLSEVLGNVMKQLKTNFFLKRMFNFNPKNLTSCHFTPEKAQGTATSKQAMMKAIFGEGCNITEFLNASKGGAQKIMQSVFESINLLDEADGLKAIELKAKEMNEAAEMVVDKEGGPEHIQQEGEEALLHLIEAEDEGVSLLESDSQSPDALYAILCAIAIGMIVACALIIPLLFR
eukprot:gnl/MRDRNA2_/MRDRNA2_107026_c0_seq1.p1 gnl/MRDRNA2_/MRDRNA2_107026_c0~~gnl/MRDRNA2_/MRDRNA2_107026_c0_seq1.p1  ORF type:complete len:345 (+),score=70.14 gnl/MRDRNA2_/MRDRNA2_107026_c0_seq1:130-1035(+)